MTSVTLRRAHADDARAIKRVAQRDCAPLPRGEVFVAERDGVVLAWAEAATGLVAADPFQATADLRSLLELRIAQIALTRDGHGRPRAVVFLTARRRRRTAVTVG